MTDPKLITTAIDLSGLSARRFATRLMSRDERTIRRWRDADIAIPQEAKDWLRRWLALSDSARATVVGILDAVA